MFGFVIHEELDGGESPWVAVETYHKRVTTSEAEDVEIYQDQYALLRRSAISGEEAVNFVRDIASSLVG
jgi:hypothetical protein